jgi:hypothetical protein
MPPATGSGIHPHVDNVTTMAAGRGKHRRAARESHDALARGRKRRLAESAHQPHPLSKLPIPNRP